MRDCDRKEVKPKKGGSIIVEPKKDKPQVKQNVNK